MALAQRPPGLVPLLPQRHPELLVELPLLFVLRQGICGVLRVDRLHLAHDLDKCVDRGGDALRFGDALDNVLAQWIRFAGFAWTAGVRRRHVTRARLGRIEPGA